MNGVVKKAVVLTAGMGLRSLPATKAVPKAMLAVLDKPAVQWVCEEAPGAARGKFCLWFRPTARFKSIFPRMKRLNALLPCRTDSTSLRR